MQIAALGLRDAPRPGFVVRAPRRVTFTFAAVRLGTSPVKGRMNKQTKLLLEATRADLFCEETSSVSCYWLVPSASTTHNPKCV